MAEQKTSACRRAGPRARPGFTLVEVSLAAGMGAMVLVALGSVVLIASKALPDTTSRRSFMDHMSALNRLSADVMYATRVVQVDATSITVRVPDRDGDGREEEISYSWAGKDTEPFVRKYNDAAPESLAGDIASIQLTWNTAQYANPTTYSPGATTLLGSCTSGLLTNRTTINALAWAGEVVSVSLPSGAARFTVTKVELYGRASGSADSVMSVQVRGIRSGMPNTTLLASADISESAFGSSDGWVSTGFATPAVLDAGQSVCLLASWKSGNDACDLRYASSLLVASSASMVTTSDAGATWSSSNSRSLYYKLWGVPYTANPTTYATRLTNVTVEMKDASTGTMRSVLIPLLNQPEAP